MATYYIATDGNDANSGTIGSPKSANWVNSLTAGDEAIFRGGNYYQQLDINGIDGTSLNPIVIRNHTGETPVINGGWDGETWPKTFFSPNYTNLYRFTSIMFIHDCSWLEVYGFELRNSSGEGLELFKVHDTIVHDILIDTIFMAAINVQGDNNTQTYYGDNHLYDIVAFDTVIERDWQGVVAPDGTLLTNHPVGIAAKNFVNDTLFERIELHTTGGEGITVGRNCDNVTFRDSIVSDSRSVAGYFNCSINSLFDRCLFYFSDSFINQYGRNGNDAFVFRDENVSLNPPYNAYQSESNIVRNCVMVNAKWGVGFGGKGTQKNHLIENNTMVNCTHPINVSNPASDRPPVPPTGNIFRNNLAYNNDVAQVAGGWSPSSGWTGDGNLVYGSTAFSKIPGTVITSDPQLNNPDGAYAYPLDIERFRPDASSPAISAAIGSTLTVDYTSYDRGASVDIGALEYGASVGTGPDNPPLDCNDTLITNGDFSSGTTGWTAINDGTAAVTNGEYHISGTVATSPFNQLYQSGISLTSGDVMKVSFIARNNDAGNPNITIEAIQHNSPFASLGLSQLFVTTGVNTEYSTSFTVSATEADSRIRFKFTTGDFYIDNVCVRVFSTARVRKRHLRQGATSGARSGF